MEDPALHTRTQDISGKKTKISNRIEYSFVVPTFSTFRFPNKIFEHRIEVTEGNQWRWQYWLLLVFHDNGEPLKHPHLKRTQRPDSNYTVGRFATTTNTYTVPREKHFQTDFLLPCIVRGQYIQ